MLLYFTSFCYSQTESTWEERFLALPSNESILKYFEKYTSIPHIAGSPEGFEMANYTYQTFLSLGLNARFDIHKVFTFFFSFHFLIKVPAS